MLAKQAKTITIFATFIFPFIVAGQVNKSRLLFHSPDMNNSQLDTLDIKAIRVAFWSDSVVVKLNNNRKQVFASGRIWGYESANKKLYRYFNGEFIDVRQLGTPVVYSKRRVIRELLAQTTILVKTETQRYTA